MKAKIYQTIHKEERVPGGRRITLEFRTGRDHIPGILLLPEAGTPAPAALMLHGYSSRKEHMADPIGRVLLRHGIASLSIDLPLHGTRSDPLQAQSMRNPLEIFRLWRLAQEEAETAVGYLAARPEIDGSRVGIVGYSLGSFLAVTLAARDRRLRAVVVAAGGDLPANTPFASVARTIADPLRAVRKLQGRPLLIAHGRWDRTVLPEQAERLFAAAEEPKEIRWWDAGHVLPQSAADEVARWLEERLNATGGASASTGD